MIKKHKHTWIVDEHWSSWYSHWRYLISHIIWWWESEIYEKQNEKRICIKRNCCKTCVLLFNLVSPYSPSFLEAHRLKMGTITQRVDDSIFKLRWFLWKTNSELLKVTQRACEAVQLNGERGTKSDSKLNKLWNQRSILLLFFKVW